jgi:hypothetical protein
LQEVELLPSVAFAYPDFPDLLTRATTPPMSNEELLIPNQMSGCHLAHILFALAGREQVADDIAVVFFAYKFGDIPGMCFTFLICNTVLTEMFKSDKRKLTFPICHTVITEMFNRKQCGYLPYMSFSTFFVTIILY